MWKFFKDLGTILTAISASRPAPSEEADPASFRTERRMTAHRERVDRRTRYIQAQAFSLAERYSKNDGEGIELDEEGFDWLIIPRFSMPTRWEQRYTRLMILFPAAYPDVPPTGFYMEISGGLKGGGTDGHLFKGGGYYDEAPDLSEYGWHWYCVHPLIEVRGGWKPSSDPELSDNLFTLLNMVREALTTND
jgi:hypothetical protein